MAFVPSATSALANRTHSFAPAISRRSPLPKRTLAHSRRNAAQLSMTNGAPLTTPEEKFSIRKTVMPADSDYSTFMWHGTYLRWLEEARVLYLSRRNLPYEYLMYELNTELPVRDLSIRYILPIRIGDEVDVTLRLGSQSNKVRLTIINEFVRVADNKVCATAEVTLVPINYETRAVHRKWPAELTKALHG